MNTANGYRPNGYLDATRTTGTPRHVEYQVFSRVTGALNNAMRDDAPFAELAKALHDNLMLWNEIGVLVASDDNELPGELRARIYYLYEFTRKQTSRIMAKEASAGSLIEINTMIMKGLRPTPAPREAETCPA